MNLYDLQFPVRENGVLRFMTPEQLLRCGSEGSVVHPMGYLSMPERMLMHALVQHAAAVSGEIDEDAWMDGVEGTDLDSLADRLFARNPEKLRRGLDLFGPAAFMQAPNQLFDDVSSESIEGIFQPIRARVKGSTKALRGTEPITGVCPPCAGVGLLVTQMFSVAMSQYWGSPPAKGAAVYALDVGRVGSSILANVMHAKHPLIRGTTHKPLPWLPVADGHAGLEADGRMPFEKHLFPNERFDHPANVSLPLTRAVRLIEPVADDLGRCCTCGRADQPMVRQFKIVPEPAVFKAIGKETVAKLQTLGEKPKPAGILASMLKPGAVHPALAYVPATTGPKERKGKKGKKLDSSAFVGPRPQPVYGGVDDLRGERPAWIHMMQAVGGGERLQEGSPRLIAPQAISQLRSASDLKSSCRDANVEMFGVRSESATNPNPKYVLMAIYGVAHLLRDDASAADLVNMSQNVVGAVDRAIAAWIDAAQRLDYDVKETHTGWELKAPKSDDRRANIRGAVARNPMLRANARSLWAMALAKVNELSDLLLQASSTTEDVSAAQQQAIEDIKREAARGWRRFMQSCETGTTSMKQLFLESSADKRYRLLMADKKPDEKKGPKARKPVSSGTRTPAMKKTKKSTAAPAQQVEENKIKTPVMTQVEFTF